jgi:phage tail P2-like protein
MEDNVLASAISNVPHLAAFDKLASKRLDAVAMDKLLVYLIDTVDASALPWLAKQFDVLGFRGMRLATTEAQQREVIKTAIQLKRTSGTPWAVKNALKAIGYPNAVLVENAGTGPWGAAEFEIKIDAGENPVSAAMIADLVSMINIYKGARNHLKSLSYQVNFSDGVVLLDQHNLEPAVGDSDTLFIGVSRFANGAYIADGSIDASSDSDSLTMEVITL